MRLYAIAGNVRNILKARKHMTGASGSSGKNGVPMEKWQEGLF